jgi:glycosyltransferase involved in cell wall biosynthesis
MNSERDSAGFDVAVVIPTYNRADYLTQAVESVLAQTGDLRLQIVLVDDGSTDQTPRVIAEFVERYGHPSAKVMVRALHQRNQGQAVARNYAISQTTAPLIAFLDDDDVCEPNRLIRQAQALRDDPSIGLVHTSFRYIDEAGRFTDQGPQRLESKLDGDCVRTLLDEMWVIFSSVMARRSVIEQIAAMEPHGLPFDPQWVRAQDYDLVLRIASVSRFCYLREPLLRYRLHGGNHAMAAANLKRTYGFHCRVQMDFARRHGARIGVDEASAKRSAAAFLYGRAEASFWRRELEVARQLCDLADELQLNDPRFADLRRKASRPAWLYAAKDWVDSLRRPGRRT